MPAKIPKPSPPVIPSDVERIATAVQKVAEGFAVLRSSRLTERAVIILVADASGVGRDMVKKVLFGLDDLERLYLKARQ